MQTATKDFTHWFNTLTLHWTCAWRAIRIGDSFDIGFISLQRCRFRWGYRFIKIYYRNIYGPHRPEHFLSIKWCTVSQKQTCVSHIAPEAEIVAANAAVRLEGLPALQLWDVILERKVIATLLEDSQALTHRVNSAWLSDVFRTCDQMDIKYYSIQEQSANIMTKGFTNADNWDRATALVGMRSKDDTKHFYGINVIPPPAKIPKSSKPNRKTLFLNPR